MDEDRYEKIKRRHEDFQKWISDKRKSNGNVFRLPKHPDLIEKERKFSLYENRQRHTEKSKSKNIAETDYISTSKFKSKNKKHFWEEATPFLIGHKDCTQPDEFFRYSINIHIYGFFISSTLCVQQICLLKLIEINWIKHPISYRTLSYNLIVFVCFTFKLKKINWIKHPISYRTLSYNLIVFVCFTFCSWLFFNL